MVCSDEISDISVNMKPEFEFKKFRKLINLYISRHNYVAAEFWANKLVTLNNGSAEDIFLLAQCYFYAGKYHRALYLISSNNLLKQKECGYIAARCQYEIGDYMKAYDILEQLSYLPQMNANITSHTDIDDIEASIDSSIHVLKGYLQEAMDNRVLAIESFKIALKYDPLCYEAFQALTQHNMLPLQEEKDLIESLKTPEFCNKSEAELFKISYCTQLNKFHEIDCKLPPCLTPLKQNQDFLTSKAEALYYSCDYESSFKITQQVLQIDSHHPQCLTVHIACLVELKRTNDLFLLSHKLVECSPTDALSWFAVGSYYYLIGKHDNARRYLSKATTVDRTFGPAWIAYGHAFAAENEHDQARAAYYKAAQLMPGCHLPLLYIGIEYSLTNNPKFAEKFFRQSLEIASEDPFVHHELGVVAFTYHDYLKAEKYFEKAITTLNKRKLAVLPEKWSALIHNMGQTCIKLGKYEEAFDCLQECLRISPGSSSTYTSIGLVQAYLGDYQDAISTLHKALSLQKDNTVAASLLSTIVNQVVNSSLPELHVDITFDRMETTSAKEQEYSEVLEMINKKVEEIQQISESSGGKQGPHSAATTSERTTRKKSTSSNNSSSNNTPKRISNSTLGCEEMDTDESP